MNKHIKRAAAAVLAVNILIVSGCAAIPGALRGENYSCRYSMETQFRHCDEQKG